MTLEQWDLIRFWANNPDLNKNQQFICWLWNGGPEGRGLESDLQYLAFDIWNRLYRDGNERKIGRRIAEKAVSQLRGTRLTEAIVIRGQEIVQALIELVEMEAIEFLRFRTIDGLYSPEYIFRD